MLSAVYIKGFKTFARPVRMPLEGGVTAVVGPNGSGKSNMTDAVLFALGEQSPGLLRAGTMGDLIFSGSESLAKTNVAEVTLVFDNTKKNISLPYEEVSLTRRISREGGTEYRINGSRARLSDVRSVAGEAGLGRHSILRQGAVDAIVAGGAEACRLAVEETAGLGVYRRRRLSAGRRLAKANEQLDQSRNIETELAGQLAKIEREARAAREYREIEARYRRFSLAHLHSVATRGTSALEERIRSERDRAGRLEVEAGESSRDEAEIGQSLRNAEGEMLRIEKLFEGLEDASEAVRRGSLAASRNVLQAESRTGNEEQRVRIVARLEAEGERVRRELKVLRTRHEEASREHTEKEARRSEAERTASQAWEKASAAERRHDSASREFDRASAKLAALKGVPGLTLMEEEDLTRLAKDVGSVAELGVFGEDGMLELREALLERGRKVATLRAEANRGRGVLQAAGGRFEARKKRLEGSREKTEGPRLFEIVRSRPGYESAVEAAFSEYGEGMLAAGVEEGVRMVSNSERVAVRLDASGVEDHPFDGKPLLECVEILDDRFAGAVRRLLGGTYLVEDADAARLANGHVAVTKSGLRLTRTSVSLVRAGRYTVEARLAATRRLIEDLEDGPTTVLGETEREVEAAAARLARSEDTLQRLRSLTNRSSQAKDALAREAARLLRQQEKAKGQAGERASSEARLREEVARLRDEMEEASGELEEAKRERSASASERDAVRVRADESARILRKIRRAVSEGARRVDGISSSLERIEATESPEIGDPGSLAARVVAVAEILTTGISARRGRTRLVRAEGTENYRALSTQQNELARKTAEMKAEIKASKERVSGLETSLENARNSVAEAEAEVREEWAATLEDARREADSLTEMPEEIEAQRNRLARRLKRFGDVNLLALSQEEEIRERHDTIRDQRTDAEEAAEEINRIILEVDREIENRFTVTFERVKATFSEMVPRMLSGGGGSLDLTDEGVEVGVRLGRKGWRSLKVLSGGERSLLALSFLFSILLSRGDGASTFCILDEAEAALDDVNLARFIAVVDSQRAKGQFILVTHQKRTMAAADILYGIVQDASGATSVVSKRIQGD
ncbi:MAG: AAA family ATPase [Rubrobacter sp.]